MGGGLPKEKRKQWISTGLNQGGGQPKEKRKQLD